MTILVSTCRKLLVIFLLSYLIFAGLRATASDAQTAPTPHASSEDDTIVATALAMPAAIDMADWNAFIDLFTDDIVMTFPFRPDRATNREELTAVMKPIFDRNQSRLPGPIFGFQPSEVNLQRLGNEGAVVSWIMVRESNTAYRTAVLRKKGGNWLIAVVHGENRPNSGSIPVSSVRDQLLGAWTLTHIESRTDVAGAWTHDDVLGSNPKGLVLYDPAGMVSVQLERAERASDLIEHNREVINGFVSYFGTYTVDEDAVTISHTSTSHLNPELKGETIARHFVLGENRLTLTWPDKLFRLKFERR